MEQERKGITPKEARGSVKEAIGKLTGDARAEREGAAEKACAQKQRKRNEGSRQK